MERIKDAIWRFIKMKVLISGASSGIGKEVALKFLTVQIRLKAITLSATLWLASG